MRTTLARWSFQRTALRAARRIGTMMKGKVVGKVAVKATSRPAGSERQRYYTPVVAKGQVPEETEIPEFTI